MEWHHIKCKLKKHPNTRRNIFRDISIFDSWIEIPIGIHGSIHGKLVVLYPARAKKQQDCSGLSEMEIALLSYLGQYVSILIHTTLENIRR